MSQANPNSFAHTPGIPKAVVCVPVVVGHSRADYGQDARERALREGVVITGSEGGEKGVGHPRMRDLVIRRVLFIPLRDE